MSCTYLVRLVRNWRRKLRVNENTTVPPLPEPKLPDQNQLNVTDLADQDDMNFLLLGCLPGQGSFTLRLPDVHLTSDSPHFNELQNYLNQIAGVVNVDCQYHTGRCDFLVSFSTAEEAAMAFATHPVIDIGTGVHHNFEYADTNPLESTTESDLEPARKRMKVADAFEADVKSTSVFCGICSTTLDGALTRPCISCKTAWCNDCIKNNFHAVLTDLDRFPARCCHKVMHYDVFRDAVDADLLDKYKARFEEFSTTRPVYCANVRCSIFLPSRIARADEQGQIHCPQCKTVTCKECRTVIEEADQHECMASAEAAALLKKFDYKSCPRCNTGIARMFGCSHIRCQCGANFCWDCLRPIRMCWSHPCAQARRDDGYDDYEEDEESVVQEDAVTESAPIPAPTADAAEPVAEHATNTVAPTQVIGPSESTELQLSTPVPEVPVANTLGSAVQENDMEIEEFAANLFTEKTEQDQLIVQTQTSIPAEQVEEPPNFSNLVEAVTHVPEPTNFETPPDAPPHTPIVEPVINLDESLDGDWAAEGLDFGDEPIVQLWDTWSCTHAFSVMSAVACKDWVPTVISKTSGRTERHVDCMRCYKSVIFDERTEVQREDEDKDLNGTPQQSVNTPEALAQNAVNPSPVYGQESTTKRKKRRFYGKPKLYKCDVCGIFHCTSCKEIAAAEFTKQLKA